MVKEFEDVLTLVGSFGRYQKWIVMGIMVPTSMLIALGYNLIIFQTLIPENYWCDAPGRHTTNLSTEEWWNLTLPRTESGEFHKCHHYYVHMENNDTSFMYVDTNRTETCAKGNWVHDKKAFEETIGTSYQWLCKEEIHSTHILATNNAGSAVGTFIFPILADKYIGRRVCFYVVCAIHVIFNALMLFSPSYGIVLALRFLSGSAFQANYQMPYVIGLELTSPENRALVSFFSFAAWTIGMCLTALVAWLIPHWWYTTIISLIPSILFFGYWKYMPESPRWLLANGKTSECCDILMNVAKVNKAQDIDRTLLMKKLNSLQSKDRSISFKELLKYRRFLFNAFCLICMACAVFMGYGCTLINVKILPNNYYLSFFVLTASELPSNVMSYLSVHYLGRRFTMIVTVIASASFSFMATLVIDNPMAMLGVVAFIKIFITQGIYVVYVMTTELFPTPSRVSGMGFVVVSGMIGVSFSPYIVQSSSHNALQYYVIIGLTLAGLLFSLPLPETMGLPLPQTYQQANVIGNNRPFFAWIHHWNKHKYSQPKESEEDSTEEEKRAIIK